MTAAFRSNRETVELPGWGQEVWVGTGSCLAKNNGLEGHPCRGLNCVKTIAKQHKQLLILLGNLVMTTKTETELNLDCHG